MSFSWLSSLAFNPERSDLEVQCVLVNGGLARFPVHSSIICAQSTTFHASLSSDNYPETQTREVKISSFTPRVLEYFLRYFYTNSVPRWMLFEDLLSLLQIAHLCGTQNLVDLCCSKLSFDVSVDTVCELFEVAKLINIPSLVEKCRSFALRFWPTIIKYDLHFTLSLESLRSFLTAHQSESDIEVNYRLQASKRWLNWNSCAHGAEIDNVNQVCYAWSLQDDRSAYITCEQDNPWPCELYCTSYLSDTEIMIEGNEIVCFPAHSVVLKKHSEVFLMLWRESTPAEGQKHQHRFKQCEARVVEYFLRFLYTRFFPSEMTLKNILSLFQLAHEYQVKDLISKVQEVLLRKISVQNCCYVLALTRNLPCLSVYDKCIRIASLNLVSILRNYLHFALDQPLLTSVLRASALRFDSRNEYLQSWGKWHCIVQGSNLRETDSSSLVEILVSASYMNLP